MHPTREIWFDDCIRNEIGRDIQITARSFRVVRNGPGPATIFLPSTRLLRPLAGLCFSGTLSRGSCIQPVARPDWQKTAGGDSKGYESFMTRQRRRRPRRNMHDGGWLVRWSRSLYFFLYDVILQASRRPDIVRPVFPEF